MPLGVLDAATRRRLVRELDESKARQVMAADAPRAAIEALVRGGGAAGGTRRGGGVTRGGGRRGVGRTARRTSHVGGP